MTEMAEKKGKLKLTKEVEVNEELWIWLRLPYLRCLCECKKCGRCTVAKRKNKDAIIHVENSSFPNIY